MLEISERCRGRWTELLKLTGFPAQYLSGKHGPCPMCGGKDRFRYCNTEGKGTFVCNQCTNGKYEDGFELLKMFHGWSFRQAVESIERHIGAANRDYVKAKRNDEQLSEEYRRIWDMGRLVEYGDPVSRYLEGRGLVMSRYPSCIRYAPSLKFGQGTDLKFDAMISAMRDNDGNLLQVHKTFLDDSARKIDRDQNKQYHWGRKVKGISVQMGQPKKIGDSICLGIAEGIETALSCALEHKIPVWATGDGGLLMAWNPPENVEEIYIFGDNDLNFAGQSYAYALANRLAKDSNLHIVVSIPPTPGHDWNDDTMQRIGINGSENSHD